MNLYPKPLKEAREYSRKIIMYAPEHNQRTGQYLFNGLPEGARDKVRGQTWDPFRKEMSQYEIEDWVIKHLIFNENGSVIGVCSGNRIFWER